MKQTLTTLALALCLVGSTSAFAADQTLAARHGNAWPKSQDGYVTKGQCMQCHGNYDQLAAKTAKKTGVNPHYSHLGEVNCVECHQPDKAKPELMCNSCHRFAQ